MRSDDPVVHRDRDRARDVIRYEWDGDHLATSEHDTIEIRNRSGYAGPRTPARVEMLADPAMSGWITIALSLAYCAALDPGDFLIFRDDTFLHDVTPLIAGSGVQTRRDAWSAPSTIRTRTEPGDPAGLVVAWAECRPVERRIESQHSRRGPNSGGRISTAKLYDPFD